MGTIAEHVLGKSIGQLGLVCPVAQADDGEIYGYHVSGGGFPGDFNDHLRFPAVLEIEILKIVLYIGSRFGACICWFGVLVFYRTGPQGRQCTLHVVTGLGHADVFDTNSEADQKSHVGGHRLHFIGCRQPQLPVVGTCQQMERQTRLP